MMHVAVGAFLVVLVTSAPVPGEFGSGVHAPEPPCGVTLPLHEPAYDSGPCDGQFMPPASRRSSDDLARYGKQLRRQRNPRHLDAAAPPPARPNDPSAPNGRPLVGHPPSSTQSKSLYPLRC